MKILLWSSKKISMSTLMTPFYLNINVIDKLVDDTKYKDTIRFLLYLNAGRFGISGWIYRWYSYFFSFCDNKIDIRMAKSKILFNISD